MKDEGGSIQDEDGIVSSGGQGSIDLGPVDSIDLCLTDVDQRSIVELHLEWNRVVGGGRWGVAWVTCLE